MRRTDPRIRQTLNQISQTVDSAQYTTRTSLYTFHQNYLSPCLAHVSTCLEASCAPCYTCIANATSSSAPEAAARRRRNHGRRRGREELSFDFYDDWAAEEEEGWGNDELDRLLTAGNKTAGGDGQPGRRKGMGYGATVTSRRKGGEDDMDANIVPQSSMFGFLERLPWKIGGRGRRYKPSAADLQDVGEGTRGKAKRGEDEPLISESESGGEAGKGERGHGRKRSGTVGSRETNTSLSSRGDLFPSEDEDDAVPLDDEFAMVLARRTTQGTLSDDNSRGKSRAASARTKGSRSPGSAETKRRRASGDDKGEEVAQVPSMTDLKEEEERVRVEEEGNIEREREAARMLAEERGLLDPDELRVDQPPLDETKEDTSVSIHPVSSHDSRPPNPPEPPDNSEERDPGAQPANKPPQSER
ncbi:MAG: hypothetical protein LQ338_001553 [Usnochroma carphineum]|nr:MAG: hypothetical protein LQ338_001553 [Usnochroma carphineum]